MSLKSLILAALLFHPGVVYSQMTDAAAAVKLKKLLGPVEAMGTVRNHAASNWSQQIGVASLGCRQPLTAYGSGLGSWDAAFTDYDKHPPMILGPYKGTFQVSIGGSASEIQAIQSVVDGGVLDSGGVQVVPNSIHGQVTIQADAEDADTGIVGVQLLVDGVNYGAEMIDTAVPFARVWDTASVPDGPHQVSAIARDNAGNKGTTVLPVMVSNTSVPIPGLVAVVTVDLSHLIDGLHVVCINWHDSVGRVTASDPLIIRVDYGSGSDGGVILGKP
ncbi:MAG: Ig-like domain-containing protein [Nitrospiraceae bacterium]